MSPNEKTSSASGCGCVFCILPLIEIMSTPVAAPFPPASWLTNSSFIHPLQFQGVIFSRHKAPQWKSDHAMLEPLCAFTVSFLHFFSPWTPPFFFFFWIWPVFGCCGVSCCSIASSLSLYWSALFRSEGCSLHILILPSLSVSKITIFQGIEKNKPMHFPFNKLPPFF